MLNIVKELNAFITVLYGKPPTMNKTWQQLYPEAFQTITKDLYRFHVTALKTALPCDQTQFMTFLAYEERTHINNVKFIHPLEAQDAMQLLQLSARIRTKVQAEYNEKQITKQTGKKG